MRITLIFILCFLGFSNLSYSVEVKAPRVPSEVMVAGMKLKITEAARRDIQKDVDALHQSPKYFNIKLDRAKLYFPIIENVFKQEGIPDDLKYLAIQESALISDAVSSADAVGFWQFKDFTGREVGLRIDKYVDERLNIVSSTHGVSKYFRRHNFYFKNWIYTVLAHMTGQSGAKKHVDRSNFGAKKMTIDKNSHWYVKRFLSHFIAFRGELKGRHSEGLNLLTYEKGAGKSLEQIAKNFKADFNEVSKYNKWLKRGKVPDQKTYTVLIPTTKKVRVKTGDSQPAEVPAATIEQPETVEKTYPKIGNRINTSKTIFIKINGIPSILSKRNDNVDSLARKGKVKLRKLLKYNDMAAGDPVKEGEIYYLRPKRNRANIYFYTVNQKESMWEISQKFGIKVSKLAKLNRMLTIDEPELGRVMWLREKRPSDTPVEIKEVIKNFINTDETEIKLSPTTIDPVTIVPETNGTPEVEISPTKDEVVNLETNVADTVIELKENTAEMGGIHIVQAGETLYGISNQYGISVEEIISSNELDSNNLSLGQRLRIQQSGVAKNETENSKNTEGEMQLHEVEAGETLYGIAKMYGVSVDNILKWNGLKTSSLNLNQKLKIYSDDSQNEDQPDSVSFHEVQPGDTLYGISKKYNVTVEQLLDLNNKTNTSLEIGEKILVK